MHSRIKSLAGVQDRASELGLSFRIEQLRRTHLAAASEICVERARLMTDYALENRLLTGERVSILEHAKMYRYMLERRSVDIVHKRVYGSSGQLVANEADPLPLFAGSTTSKFKGVPLYPEFLAHALWPELLTLTQRHKNPYRISAEEIEQLNTHIFPTWMRWTVGHRSRMNPCSSITNAGTDRLREPLDCLPYFLTSKLLCVSHTIPDFAKVVSKGLRHVLGSAESRRECEQDSSRREFYSAIVEVLEGIIQYSRRLSRVAGELASRESDPIRRQELLTLRDIYRHVPEYPARNFREGLTSIGICWTAILLENSNTGLSLGRLDQVLGGLYKEDIQSGRLSAAFGLELCCSFWLKLGDHSPAVPTVGEDFFGGTGVNQAVTVGGIDAAGRDAVNELTYMLLRSAELMKLRDPNLNARFCPGANSVQYLRRLCEVNIATGAAPAIHNDLAVIEALTRHGDTLEQARDYGIVGCVEPCSAGRAYGHSAAILFNLPAALEVTLFNGAHRLTGLNRVCTIESGPPSGFESFEQFQSAFLTQIEWLAERSTHLNNELGEAHRDHHPVPILSAFFEGPLDKGVDLSQGGATINSSGVAIVGFADVVDSLCAIEYLVYEQKSVSFDTLLEALKQNFVGYEVLERRLSTASKVPKYGSEHPMATRNARWLVSMLDSTFSRQRNSRGGGYRVGYWSMTTHVGWGKLSGALPSGRRAQEAFASGITPVSNSELGLTSVLNSVAALPSVSIASGAALNIKYQPEPGRNGVDGMAATVAGYFEGAREGEVGGLEIQFNVTTNEMLREAMLHPERFSELLVRVSGYTAYFKDLGEDMQKEIIERTQYELGTGQALQPMVLSLSGRTSNQREVA